MKRKAFVFRGQCKSDLTGRGSQGRKALDEFTILVWCEQVETAQRDMSLWEKGDDNRVRTFKKRPQRPGCNGDGRYGLAPMQAYPCTRHGYARGKQSQEPIGGDVTAGRKLLPNREANMLEANASKLQWLRVYYCFFLGGFADRKTPFLGTN